jgi:hypothetical protein
MKLNSIRSLQTKAILNGGNKVCKEINQDIKSARPCAQANNKRFNLDWWAFAAAQVLAAFVLFRNSFTKFAWQKLAGLSPAN